MFGTIFALSARGAGSTRRRTRARAAIVLWLWSSWVIAAGCCCQPAELGMAVAASHPQHAGPAAAHDHDHGHPASPAPEGLNHAHSQGAPADDCGEIKVPPHGIVPKEAAPAWLLTLDHVVLAPAPLADLPDLWGDPHDDWSLPPPPIRSSDPSLETVRLLL